MYLLKSNIVRSQLIGCNNNPCKNNAKCIKKPFKFKGYTCTCKLKKKFFYDNFKMIIII